MAQAICKDVAVAVDTGSSSSASSLSPSLSAEAMAQKKEAASFRFNAAAPEFVPRTQAPATIEPVATSQPPLTTGYFYPCFQYLDATSSGSWIYVADQETVIPLVQPKPNAKSAQAQAQEQSSSPHAKDVALSDELKQKIIKQAEYMFSEMSMLANESFAKHVYKDPEGYVPINFVTTKKKLKSLNVTNQMVAQALKFSTKLVVSSDGKKVKRKIPFTEKEKEDLQLRTVIAENLPDDHSHQNIEKLFNVVGSIKAIRICQPQEQSNSSRSSKGDLVVSNKLHALVEYENPETAEKAAEKLNDERNWRRGMRVRVMLKRSPKSVLKTRKSDFDVCFNDDHAHDDSSRLSSLENSEDEEVIGSAKKSWTRNRVKPKQHRPLQTARSLPSSYTVSTCPGEISSTRTVPKGPRMPDGTRGFTMGRGKPLTVTFQ